MPQTQRDIGFMIDVQPGILAATGVENAEQTGPWVDRLDFYSCVMAVQVDCALLTNAESFSIAGQIEDAVDAAGTGVADYGEAAEPLVISNTEVAPAPFSGVLNHDHDLHGARRFIRMKATVTPSNGTDVCNMSGMTVMGGAVERPA